MRRVVTGLGVSLAGVGVVLLAVAVAISPAMEPPVFWTATWGFGLVLAGALAAGVAHWGTRGALFGGGVAFLLMGFSLAAAALAFQQGVAPARALGESEAFEVVLWARMVVAGAFVLILAGATAIAVFAYVNQQAAQDPPRASGVDDTAHAPLRGP